MNPKSKETTSTPLTILVTKTKIDYSDSYKYTAMICLTSELYVSASVLEDSAIDIDKYSAEKVASTVYSDYLNINKDYDLIMTWRKDESQIRKLNV